MYSKWVQNVLLRALRYSTPPRATLNKTHQPPYAPFFFATVPAILKCSFPTHAVASVRPTWSLPLIIPAGLFSFLAPKDPDGEDTPEGKLIMCIKRSILCIQREQYAKAEQMLHLALRMAQDLQDKEGITFVFDVMANLAMETEQYKKAERLFVTVMQRLLADGCKEDDIKMLHISSKVAHLESLQGNLEKAEVGFVWVLEKINKQLAALKDEAATDLQELAGITKDCYAQLLMQLSRFEEAKRNFVDALDVYTQIHGRDDAEVVSLLNNLAVVCTNLNDLIAAEAYITEALKLAQKFPELYEMGVFQANHGMLLMKQGLLDQARQVCSSAWRTAKRSSSQEGQDQADHCLKELKKLRINE